MRPLAPLLVSLALGACTPDASDRDDDTDAPPSFSVVVIPDSQIYARSFPDVLRRHGDWIVEHRDDEDIRFVSHVGDIVNDGESVAQWDAAKQAFGTFQDIDLPHGFSPANHDVGSWAGWPSTVDSTCAGDPEGLPRIDCAFTNYLEAFGPQHYTDRPWYGGASPTGWSSYQTIDAEGLPLLFLHLPMDPPEAEVAWAEQVLDDHPDRLVHITTHRYLYDFRITEVMPPPLDLFLGGRVNGAVRLFAGGPMLAGGLDADALFARLVAPHRNVWAIECGHYDAELRRQAVDDAGLAVNEILVDFQDMADGGGGFLRLLKFFPTEDRVEVWTVSTETGELRENGDGFEHSIDLLGAYAGDAFGALEGLGFDTSTFDAMLAQLDTDEALRAQYRASLYDDGARDSRFVLDVPFDAHLGR
ncbi:MAG: metallophosphoesterase [Alphaproteobacteria bacterium]|nr:metallophosphoesterase [Alphaproteobacteria bacterium]